MVYWYWYFCILPSLHPHVLPSLLFWGVDPEYLSHSPTLSLLYFYFSFLSLLFFLLTVIILQSCAKI